MGLDQYFYSDEKEHPKDAVDVGVYNDKIDYSDKDSWYRPGVEKVWYFRKHHDLQGWMSQKAEQRGGEMQWGSMVGSLVLNPWDLDELEHDVKGDMLPKFSGFFHGEGNTEGYKEETLRMIEKLREEVKKGKSIIYSCSW